MENDEQLKRWRLILGEDSEKTVSKLAGESRISLSKEELLMDNALSQIYGSGPESFGSGKSGGKGTSAPKLTKWLGDLRSLFAPMEIKVIQNDAIVRHGLKELLFEPEMLNELAPDVQTAALLLMLKDQVPKRAKESARLYIKKIVEDINKRIADDIKRSVTAALNRKNHSPIPSAAVIDYKMTIRRNLKNYNAELGKIIPDKFYFYERASKAGKRTVILDIDQSGSMGESAIYSSVAGSILASLNSLKTHVVAFDTSITDLTDLCEDPVDLLYGIQLGGGTDIEKSVAYCQSLITEPSKTTMFIVTDLYEGGNATRLLARLKNLKEDGVNVIVLLAISDSGHPCYCESMAQKTAQLEIPCFAAPPEKLPEILSKAINRQKLSYI